MSNVLPLSVHDLEQQLKQAKIDKAGIEDNIENLKKQIKEATEIKPRHGDIVVATCGGKRIVVENNGVLCSYSKGGFCQLRGDELDQAYNDKYHVLDYKVIGNVFD